MSMALRNDHIRSPHQSLEFLTVGLLYCRTTEALYRSSVDVLLFVYTQLQLLHT